MANKNRAIKPSALTIVLLLFVAIATLYVAQDVLIPIVLAVLLAFLLGRPVAMLEERRIGRITSVLTVVTVAFIFILTLGYVVGQQVYSLADNLEKYQGEVERKFATLTDPDSGMGRLLKKLDRDVQQASQTPATLPATTTAAEGVVEKAASDIAADPIRAGAREVVDAPPATAPAPPGTAPANPLYVTQAENGTPVQILMTYVGTVAGPLGTAGLVVVFVVFMLLEREALRDRIIHVISRGNYTTTTRAINDAAARISRYLFAQSIVNGTYGLTIGIGLFVIGWFFGNDGTNPANTDPVWFPSFVLWGLLCAVLRFIPYVGPAVSSIAPIALSLAAYDTFSVAIAVVILFVVIELISNNVMEPWLYGASTGLSTVSILIAAVFWTWLWGSIGLLVATPLTVIMMVMGKYVPALNFLNVLLSDEDALPPAVGFYQRLLAGAQPDAERIVRRVADADGPTAVADTVYLPALRLARRDRAENELTAEDETRIFDDTLAIVRPPGSVVEPEPVEGATVVPSTRPLMLACPAHHRADEVTLHVLAEALLPLGVRTTVLSTRSLPADVEAAVEREKPALVVIGILPPGGLTQTRYLCRRLRRKFPDLPILVGFWGRVRDFDSLLIRLRDAGASYVLTSVEQTRGQVGAMLPKPPAPEPVSEVPNPS